MLQELLLGHSIGSQLAFYLSFSMAFVSPFYILFYVRERVIKSKHLQFVSGIKFHIFWSVSFLCDLISFVGTIVGIIATLVFLQEEGFQTSGDLARIFVILFCFGFSMLPMMYFASYWFDVPSTGYTRMALLNLLTGTNTPKFIIQWVNNCP